MCYGDKSFPGGGVAIRIERKKLPLSDSCPSLIYWYRLNIKNLSIDVSSRRDRLGLGGRSGLP